MIRKVNNWPITRFHTPLPPKGKKYRRTHIQPFLSSLSLLMQADSRWDTDEHLGSHFNSWTFFCFFQRHHPLFCFFCSAYLPALDGWLVGLAGSLRYDMIQPKLQFFDLPWSASPPPLLLFPSYISFILLTAYPPFRSLILFFFCLPFLRLKEILFSNVRTQQTPADKLPNLFATEPEWTTVE